MQSVGILRRAATVSVTAGLAAALITSFMAVQGFADDTSPGGSQDELFASSTVTVESTRVTLENPGPAELCPDEESLCIGETSTAIATVAGTTATAETTAVAETTTVAAATTAVGGTATSVRVVAPEARPAPVVAGVSLTAPAATAVVSGVTALPRAGGSPVASSLLAGLGLLLAAGGLATRRITR